MYREITQCRICGNKNLIPLVNLGILELTGIFPKERASASRGPLELCKCAEEGSDRGCGLVQLKHDFALDQLYGLNYGYRSGLNKSMVEHLHAKVGKILARVDLKSGDFVIDIGSNDSTLLQAYPKDGVNLIGVDPTGAKFFRYYPEHIDLIVDFFPCERLRERLAGAKVKIITSIAMFYDLERPIEFVQNIYDALDDEGVWVFEQSYMPTMLDMNAYDTICHEHLEYYALKQIKYMMDKVGLKIVDVEFNAVNGGSFSVMVAKNTSSIPANEDLVNQILHQEEERGLSILKPYQEFQKNIEKHRADLLAFIQEQKATGKSIFGYGASTKGNVILQYCGITEKDIPYIAEVNEDKFGSFTPGSKIPIISEAEAKKMNPDLFMVLPWHFRDNIVRREQDYLAGGGHLFFPLPKLEVV
ncbi:methyltransferase domain-containing protein [Candidatus Peregrinibacteria bacterium]|nr:methyltransferase domain-containing protein [Candidatus Peregrinibacteria bacterium]